MTCNPTKIKTPPSAVRRYAAEIFLDLQQKMQGRLDSLKTGDLLLFEGVGFTSNLIKVFTDSLISHAAIVWKCPVTQEIYLFETGDVTEGCLPLITRRNRPTNSAHLVSLRSKLNAHNKRMYVRRLKCKHPLDSSRLDVFIARNLGKLYTSNLVALWMQRGNPTLISLPFLEEETEFARDHEYKEYMCSQICILAYYYLGVVKLFDGYTHTITPGDMYEDIVTIPGYEFERPEMIWSIRSNSMKK